MGYLIFLQAMVKGRNLNLYEINRFKAIQFLKSLQVISEFVYKLQEIRLG